MRIVQISNFPPSVLGGMEAVVYNLSKELGAKGHEVDVITSTHDSKIQRVYRDNFRIFYVPSIEVNSRMVLPKNLSVIRRVIEGCEIVHLHSPDVSFALEIGVLSKIQRKPIVTSILAFLDVFSHPFLSARIFAFPIGFSTSFLAKISECVHVKNALDYARLSKISNEVVYIPDGITDCHFKAERDPNLFSEKFGIEGKKVILYVGRLHRLKGPQVLIQSLKFIVEEEPEAVLAIVGPGEDYRKYLEILAEKLDLEDHVTFAGVVTESEKISAYDAAQLVAIPSCGDSVEAFSLVASEAWARGKPVVASNVGALRCRVKPGINGYLAEPNSPNDLAKKILRAFDMRVKEVPSDVCDWKHVAKMFEQLYRRVMSSLITRNNGKFDADEST